MLPNILQLAGAILTLITALLTSLGLFGKTLDTIRKVTPGIKELNEQAYNKQMEILKNSQDLRRYTRELAYGSLGIILIVSGYILAATGIDYIENLGFYFLSPIIILLVPTLYNGYHFLKFLLKYKKIIKSWLLFSLIFAFISLVVFLLMYSFKWFAIASGFLGSTILLIYASTFIIEGLIVNWIFQRELSAKLKNEVDYTSGEIEQNAINAQESVTNINNTGKNMLELIEEYEKSKDNK